MDTPYRFSQGSYEQECSWQRAPIVSKENLNPCPPQEKVVEYSENRILTILENKRTSYERIWMNLRNKLGKEATYKRVWTCPLCQRTGKTELCVSGEHSGIEDKEMIFMNFGVVIISFWGWVIVLRNGKQDLARQSLPFTQLFSVELL